MSPHRWKIRIGGRDDREVCKRIVAVTALGLIHMELNYDVKISGVN